MDFDAVYNENRDRVFKLCYRRLKHHEDAEDVTQETFLAAYKLFDSFRGDSSVWTWLYAIAKFRILSFKFRWKDTVSLDDDDQQTHRNLPADETPIETKIALAEAMGALATGYRRAVFLTDVCGYTSKEAERMTGRAGSTLRNQLLVGREQLRYALRI